MSKILILGATGYIGGLTARELSSKYPGHQLRLVSSRTDGCADLMHRFPAAQVVQADWNDLDSLRPAMQGIDRVLIVTPDFSTDETIVTANIVAAARSSGRIQQLLRLIAIPPGLTAQKLSPAERATRCGAALHTVAKPILESSGLPVTFLNVPCWIMFNLPWFLAEDVKARQRLAMPAKSDAARLWVSEEDIAAVAARLLTDPPDVHVGEEYRLTGAVRYTYAGLADLLSEVLGERILYVDDDSTLKRVMGERFDTLMTYFQHETRDYGCVPVSDTVSRLLGRPQVSLEGYLKANKQLFTR